jgi:hypothetical protein
MMPIHGTASASANGEPLLRIGRYKTTSGSPAAYKVAAYNSHYGVEFGNYLDPILPATLSPGQLASPGVQECIRRRVLPVPAKRRLK